MFTEYQTAEFHCFERLGKRILFNVETLLAYEVSPVVFDVVALLKNPSRPNPVGELTARHSLDEIRAAVTYLEKEKFLYKNDKDNAFHPALKKWRGIRHLELMVTHDCNMRCRYCYGSSGLKGWKEAPYLYGARTKGMSLETAQRGVDFLFGVSGNQKKLSVIFFGGEPLLSFDLIKEIVPYIRQKETDTGKTADLSLSTNGLLLSREVVDFLVKERIGCQVSMDGPPEIHDQTRQMAGGGGSYEAIIKSVKRLLAARPGRSPARVTVAHGAVDIPTVVEHLLNLGFGSVHVEPAMGNETGLSISREDLPRIKGQNEEMAHFMVRSVQKGRFFNYTDLVRFIRQTRVVRNRQAHYCGAGRTYFALSQEGDFYPCHRFVGMEAYQMGNLSEGMDLTLQRRILNLTVDDRPVCRECWARYLCGGGCWKHAVDAHGALETPDETVSCDITRHLIECALAVNSELDVSDQEILSDLYEENTEPYLVTEKEETDDGSIGERRRHGAAGVSGVAV